MLIVGVGGTQREGSSTELALRAVLDATQRAGAEVQLFAGQWLELPLYYPGRTERCDRAIALVDALRRADGIVIGSPGYHGGISGLVKNALDYAEDLSGDPRPYFEGRAVGCIATGGGFQGAHATLTGLRSVAHALRGWPTPLGIAINTREPAFNPDRSCIDPALTAQLEMMAAQLIEFAAMRCERQ
ncbi:NAD(P)H-dependent oxidoreductase [Sphingomonas sp. AOB5]|uniref:NADPH-dependent FMN reductase n=1 Tax=Sphingomonas sp. AOB5 TaxID=3034017 RepID=UPI0023FA19FC|nr:NAD(P)H-dependent oxidoreductase [Sphingomonas sp. AOB5]MDF7774842.1 NAD(P)H-dependent oxidoreductase [Sphingomonas sp. AOB5]